jgi:Uncharacterised protein family (UPF0236)
VQVAVFLKVEVPSTASFAQIEQACVNASRKAGNEAIGQLLQRRERDRGKRPRQSGGGRRRTVLTRVGYVTFHRGRGRRPDGTRYFPLDHSLGLPAHHEASPWVRRRGCELAAQHPYRETARLLGEEVGATVDHRAVWRWVQAEGSVRLKQRAEAINRLFEDGEPPPAPPEPVPEALTVGIDATGIHLQDGTKASVKLAVAFTDSQPVRATAKRRLVRRTVFAEVAEVDEFGMALAHELERSYGAHRIPRMMVLADGEPWIEGLTRSWLPTARYQCDWWHVGAKVREFCRAELHRFPRLRRRAFRTTHRLAADLIGGKLGGDPEEARLLGGYLARNGPYLHTFTTMGPGHWLHGSGPAEKHIELTINRRFKRRGMSWSHRGARNLLALRLEVIAKR